MKPGNIIMPIIWVVFIISLVIVALPAFAADWKFYEQRDKITDEPFYFTIGFGKDANIRERGDGYASFGCGKLTNGSFNVAATVDFDQVLGSIGDTVQLVYRTGNRPAAGEMGTVSGDSQHKASLDSQATKRIAAEFTALVEEYNSLSRSERQATLSP